MLVTRRSSDEGSTLVSVLIVAAVLSILVLTTAAIVVNTTRSLTGTRSTLQAQAAADAGLAAAVAQARSNPIAACGTTLSSDAAPRYDVTVVCAPGTGEMRFTSTGHGVDRGSARVEAVYGYVQGSLGGHPDAALVSGAGSLNISSINIVAPEGDGDLLTISGDFDCNNKTRIQGDLIVRGGHADLSNQCQIVGNVYATDYVKIHNNAVGVTGDIVALGDFTLVGGATVGGSISARGSLIQLDGRVNGSMTAAGTGIVTQSGRAPSNIFPGARIGGNLTLGSTIDTWGAAYTVGGTTNAPLSGITIPTPAILAPSSSRWVDYAFDQPKWEAAGYTVVKWSSCDMQNTASLVTQVSHLTNPTVIDARACQSLNMYGVTLNLKTNVTFVANKFDSAQALKVNSATEADVVFNMITPDDTADNASTCVANQGSLVISDVQMSSGVSGIAYSPCQIWIGQSGSGSASAWNGQIYAGAVKWGGNGTPAMVLNYAPQPLVGFDSTGGAGGGVPSASLGGLLSRRDVPAPTPTPTPTPTFVPAP